MYLFMTVLGLPCCMVFSAGAESGGCSSLHCTLRWPPCCGARALASVVVAHGPQALERRLSTCGTRAELPHSLWHLPGSRIEPVSPALAGGSFTTKPPAKPLTLLVI